MTVPRTLAATCALVACTALPVFAAELPANDTVAVNVPIHISQIPDKMDWYQLICSFRYVGKKASVPDIGSGTESQAVEGKFTGGKIDQTFTLTLARNKNDPASHINGYFCYFLLGPAAGQEDPGYYTDPIMPKNSPMPKWILEGSF